MKYRIASRGARRYVEASATSWPDVDRIAAETADGSGWLAVTEAAARDVLQRAGLPAGAHARNRTGSWLPLTEEHIKAPSGQALLAMLPAEFSALGPIWISRTADPDLATKLSPEWYASKVIMDAWIVRLHRANNNMEGVIEWSMKLGDDYANLRAELAGWSYAAAAGFKQLSDCRKGADKTNGDSAIQHEKWAARAAELKAAGYKGSVLRKISEEDAVPYETVKKALQRKKNAMK